MSTINSQKFDRELKKGGAELLVLSLLEARPRHGYEVRKLIETRSDGVLKFNAAPLYLLLYRLEKRGWIEGRWVEKAGQRRRRYYKLRILLDPLLPASSFSVWLKESIGAIHSSELPSSPAYGPHPIRRPVCHPAACQ